MTYTLGHSTLPLADFLKLLTRAGPRVLVVDVRSVPRSRRHWFNQDRISAALTANGHTYEWLPSLGGRQAVTFYDYMDTTEFDRGIARVLRLENQIPVLLCAEADPQECHRWLIATELTAHGRRVSHILQTGKLSLHTQAQL